MASNPWGAYAKAVNVGATTQGGTGPTFSNTAQSNAYMQSLVPNTQASGYGAPSTGPLASYNANPSGTSGSNPLATLNTPMKVDTTGQSGGLLGSGVSALDIVNQELQGTSAANQLRSQYYQQGLGALQTAAGATNPALTQATSNVTAAMQQPIATPANPYTPQIAQLQAAQSQDAVNATYGSQAQQLQNQLASGRLGQGDYDSLMGMLTRNKAAAAGAAQAQPTIAQAESAQQYGLSSEALQNQIANSQYSAAANLANIGLHQQLSGASELADYLGNAPYQGPDYSNLLKSLGASGMAGGGAAGGGAPRSASNQLAQTDPFAAFQTVGVSQGGQGNAYGGQGNAYGSNGGGFAPTGTAGFSGGNFQGFAPTGTAGFDDSAMTGFADTGDAELS